MPIQGRIAALVVVMTTFFVTLLRLAPAVGVHHWLGRLVAAACLTALPALYALLADNIARRNNDDQRNNLQQGETALQSANYHRIPLLAPCYMLWSLSVALCVYGIYLLLVHPSVHFTGGTFQYISQGQLKQAGHGRHSIPIWEIPILFGCLIALPGLVLRQYWKRTVFWITNKRLIIMRQQSPYLLFPSPLFDPLPLGQINDVWYKASKIGGGFGWGTVYYTVWPRKEADQTNTRHLPFIPDAQEFANKLISVVPALKPSNEDAIL